RQLAGVGVRASDRRAHADGRVRLQSVLDDLGIDVVSAADDELLLATGEPEIAASVPPAEVAGVEPPLAVDIDPNAFVVTRIEIAREDVRAVDRDHADLVDDGHSLKAPFAV